jgi:hypothetical protein
MSVTAVAAGAVVALDLIKMGSQLLVTFAENPGMTAAEVELEVDKTQLRAKTTVDDWRKARAARRAPI